MTGTPGTRVGRRSVSSGGEEAHGAASSYGAPPMTPASQAEASGLGPADGSRTADTVYCVAEIDAACTELVRGPRWWGHLTCEMLQAHASASQCAISS